MEYLIVTALQLLGVGFHVGQKLVQLDGTHPDDSFSDVWNAFWKADRITVLISGLILLTHLIAHYVVETYTDLFLNDNWNRLIDFGIALILGYGGQSLFYKLLGRAEQFLGQKVENKLK